MPVQRIDIGLFYLRTEDLKFIRREFLVQLKGTAAVRLVLPGITLADVRLVDGTVQLVLHAVFGGKLQQRLVELALSHALVVHINTDAVLALAVAAKVCHLPDLAVALRVVLT